MKAADNGMGIAEQANAEQPQRLARENGSMSAHQCRGFGRPGSVVHTATEHHRIVAINVQNIVDRAQVNFAASRANRVRDSGGNVPNRAGLRSRPLLASFLPSRSCPSRVRRHCGGSYRNVAGSPRGLSVLFGTASLRQTTHPVATADGDDAEGTRRLSCAAMWWIWPSRW